MTKLKCRNANCDKGSSNASSRMRRENQANDLPKKNRTKQVAPNFGKEKSLFMLTFNYLFVKLSR